MKTNIMNNKKIIALFCVPLIISIMVLPLCSFTTVLNTDEFDVYKSYSNNGIRYNYTAGSTGTYEGIIPDVSRVLIKKYPSNLGEAAASIKYQACDYYLTSSYRIIIGDDYSGLREVDNNIVAPYDYILDMFYCSVPTPSDRVKFPYEVYVENITFDQYLTYYFASFYDGNPYFLNLEDWDVTVSGSLNYCWVYADAEGVDYQSETVYFSDIDVTTDQTGRYYLDVPSLCRYAVESAGLEDHSSSLVANYVSSFSCTLNVYNTVTGAINSACDGVLVSSGIVNVNSPNYAQYYLGHAVNDLTGIYDIAYNKGVNYGLSSAEGVWGSLGDYLVKSVGSFFELEFVEGVSFGDLVSFVLGFVLVMLFLKIFAGG